MDICDDASIADFTVSVRSRSVNALYPTGTNETCSNFQGGKGPCGRGYGERERSPRLPLFIQCGIDMTTGETASHATHTVDIRGRWGWHYESCIFQMDEEALFQVLP